MRGAAVRQTVEQVVAATPGVRWSVHVTDLGGQLLAAHEPDRRLSTASIGKILLLAETARRLELATLDPNEPLTRTPELAVADSGLWQHLRSDTLPLADVAVLVAAASDNYATNVLLERVGLDRVAALAAELGGA
jgi:beta-lactamase class A